VPEVLRLSLNDVRDFRQLKARNLQKIRYADLRYDDIVEIDDTALWVIETGNGDLTIAFVEPAYVGNEYLEHYGVVPLFFLKDLVKDEELARKLYRYYKCEEPLREDSNAPRYLASLLIPFEAYIHSGIYIYPIGGCQIDRQWDVVCPAGLFLPDMKTVRYAMDLDFGISNFNLSNILDFDETVAKALSNMPIEEFKQRICQYVTDQNDQSTVEKLYKTLEDTLNGCVYDVVVCIVDDDGSDQIGCATYFGHELDEDIVVDTLSKCYACTFKEADKR